MTQLTVEEKRWREEICRRSDMCQVDEIKDRIDKGIEPLVLMLRTDGFQTFCSCEGIGGCWSSKPYVLMLPDIGKSLLATSRRLYRWARAKNLKDYKIGILKQHQGWKDLPVVYLKFPPESLPPFHYGKFSHPPCRTIDGYGRGGKCFPEMRECYAQAKKWHRALERWKKKNASQDI